MPTFNMLFKDVSRIKACNLFKITNVFLLFRSFDNVKKNFNLQAIVQITQQNNKSKYFREL